MSKALILAATPNRADQTLSIPELATAGFLSAIPTTLVTAPVERAKVLLQVRHTDAHCRGRRSRDRLRCKARDTVAPSIPGYLMS